MRKTRQARRFLTPQFETAAATRGEPSCSREATIQSVAGDGSPRFRESDWKSRRDDTQQMGSSYISNHIHVVFSTKGRVRSIKEEVQPKLWATWLELRRITACTR